MNWKYWCGTLCFLCIAQTAPAQSKILFSGSGNASLKIIEKKSGNIEWEHPMRSYAEGYECNCLQMTEEGNILYASRVAAQLMTLDGKELWKYPAPPRTEIHNATRLDDGGYLLAVNGQPFRIVELDENGRQRKYLEFKELFNKVGTHGQCRQILKSRNGNYLIPHFSQPKVFEVDAEGKLVRTYQTRGGSFSVFEEKNGDLMVSLGDQHMLQWIDRKTGKEKRLIRQNDFEGFTLLFVAQAARLGRNRFMVANWAGHDFADNAPQLIEFDRKGRVKWYLHDEKYGRISTFCILPDDYRQP